MIEVRQHSARSLNHVYGQLERAHAFLGDLHVDYVTRDPVIGIVLDRRLLN
jgi:hypothetical protein